MRIVVERVMELRDALVQIAEIRQSMARGEMFRGYRAATTAFSGAVAVGTGVMQAVVIGAPEKSPLEYVGLWVGAAAICLAAVGVEMVVRTRRSQSAVQRQLTMMAVEQFVPSVAAGGLLTYGICAYVPVVAWMLPALWMVLFALGVFASARLLPRAVFGAGAFYLLAGVAALIVSGRGMAFSPWLMGGVFGVGQFLIAGILIIDWSAAMSEKMEGRYAYGGIDRVIHGEARLSIVASLASHGEGLVFGDLKELWRLTDGNLSRHLAVLQEAGVVKVEKSFVKNRPQTWCRITASGRRRFQEYVGELERVVSDAVRVKGAGGRVLPA